MKCHIGFQGFRYFYIFDFQILGFLSYPDEGKSRKALLKHQSYIVLFSFYRSYWVIDKKKEFLLISLGFFLGAEPAIFKSKFVCLRLYYHHYTDEGFFHTFRTPSTRLFNNIVIAVKNKEEAKGKIYSVIIKIETLKMACFKIYTRCHNF